MVSLLCGHVTLTLLFPLHPVLLLTVPGMEETGAETDKTLSKQSWDSKKVRATGWANSFFFFTPCLEANNDQESC